MGRTMMHKPELKQDEEGVWYVEGTVGYLKGNIWEIEGDVGCVKGSVYGNIEGTVLGTINEQEWMFKEEGL